MSVLLSPDSRIARGSDLVTVRLDDEAMLMSKATGRYYTLDAVGQTIWNRLDEPRTVSYLCEQVAKEFDVTLEQCSDDVLVFVSELLTDDLVSVVSA